MWDEAHRRVFLIERSGPSRDSFKAEARAVLEGFESYSGDAMPWEVLGLRLRLPARLVMRRFDALAGRIAMRFASRFEAVVVERWSLADRLLEQAPLADWAVKATRLRVMEDGEMTIRLADSALAPLGLLGFAKTGVVVHLVNDNALITLVRVGHGSAPLEDWVAV